MSIETAVITSSQDKGKKVYRIVSVYKLTLEQDVLADSEDEAIDLQSDCGGIDYQALNQEVTKTSCNVETNFVDADYVESDSPILLGTIDEEGNIE